MRRGEIWTVAGGAVYTGEPRPAVIVQDDRFDANDWIVVCPLTTDPTSAPIFRLPIPSNTRTGLQAPCRLMVDTLTAVPRKRLGQLVGSRCGVSRRLRGAPDAVEPGTWRNLQVFALDPYDLALAKLQRNLQRDRGDVLFLARAADLDMEVLRRRYVSELRPYQGANRSPE